MSAPAKLRPALSSSLLRGRSPAETAARAKELGFEGIEWGYEHVPHGGLAEAGEAAAASREAGLAVPAYRSNYRLLVSHSEGLRFSDAAATAAALGAPAILLRAGFKASAATTPVEQGLLRKEALKAAEEAAAKGLQLVFEFRESTWCDSDKPAIALAAIAPGVRLDFSLLPGTDPGAAAESAARMAPHLALIHISYHDAAHRLAPLADGAAFWSALLARPALAGMEGWAVLDRSSDDTGSLEADARALASLLGRA